jgi:hypothetical protein
MTAADIKALAIGKTVYLETTAASVTGKAGEGVIYWAEDGTAILFTRRQWVPCGPAPGK